MFTLQQIHDTHAKVKSWAEFPQYIQDLILLWVTSYTIFVADGHAVYHGADNYVIESAPAYETLSVAWQIDKDYFLQQLQAHQQWQTDYMTFCHDAAQSGIVKWIMNLETMDCIYCDNADNHVLIEKIPQL